MHGPCIGRICTSHRSEWLCKGLLVHPSEARSRPYSKFGSQASKHLSLWPARSGTCRSALWEILLESRYGSVCLRWKRKDENMPSRLRFCVALVRPLGDKYEVKSLLIKFTYPGAFFARPHHHHCGVAKEQKEKRSWDSFFGGGCWVEVVLTPGAFYFWFVVPADMPHCAVRVVGAIFLQISEIKWLELHVHFKKI